LRRLAVSVARGQELGKTWRAKAAIDAAQLGQGMLLQLLGLAGKTLGFLGYLGFPGVQAEFRGLAPVLVRW
jgi:hypothetical protein